MKFALFALALLMAACPAPQIRCRNEQTCPSSLPFCVDGTCAANAPSKTNLSSDNDSGDSDANGDADNSDVSSDPSEPAVVTSCEDTGCASDEVCLLELSADQGHCIPFEAPTDCAGADTLGPRETAGPIIWRVGKTLSLDPGTASAAYGCATDEAAHLISMQFFDAENDLPNTIEVNWVNATQLLSAPATTQFSIVGRLGTLTAVACAAVSTTSLAIAIKDSAQHRSNAACVSVAP